MCRSGGGLCKGEGAARAPSQLGPQPAGPPAAVPLRWPGHQSGQTCGGACSAPFCCCTGSAAACFTQVSICGTGFTPVTALHVGHLIGYEANTYDDRSLPDFVCLCDAALLRCIHKVSINILAHSCAEEVSCAARSVALPVHNVQNRLLSSCKIAVVLQGDLPPVQGQVLPA